ncbi:MAG: CDP-alcohol phosphatidyltransferase family protein [Desulfobacterales bacterium]|nr:CDP-alcohol phosphatidyltransferase family protein [Desulfobacterales bacterium]
MSSASATYSLRRKILAFFPNALTVMNAMMGLLAVFFAYQDRMREASLFLIGAALFDKLDGAVARRLGLTEPLPGEERKPRAVSLGGLLDDISDAVSFCIAPAWIYLLSRLGHPRSPCVQELALHRLVAVIYALAGIVPPGLFHPGQGTRSPGSSRACPPRPPPSSWWRRMIILNQAVERGAPDSVPFWGVVCFGMMIAAAVVMNLYPIRYLHMPAAS